LRDVIGDLINIWSRDPLMGFVATLGLLLFGGGLLWLLTSRWGTWWKRALIFLILCVAAFTLMLLGAG